VPQADEHGSLFLTPTIVGPLNVIEKGFRGRNKEKIVGFAAGGYHSLVITGMKMLFTMHNMICNCLMCVRVY